MELNWNNYVFVGYLNGGGEIYSLFFINVILNISQDKFPASFLSQSMGAEDKNEADLDEFPGPLNS